MKIITRFAILYITVGWLISSFVIPYSHFSALIRATLYALITFFMWGYFFHHWEVSEFDNANAKRSWFLVILLGGFLCFIGPLIYYIAVYEMGKGLKAKAPDFSH